MFGAYLEDYQKIKIILNDDINFDVNDVHICEPIFIRMELCKKEKKNNRWHLEYNLSTVLKFDNDIKPSCNGIP